MDRLERVIYLLKKSWLEELSEAEKEKLSRCLQDKHLFEACEKLKEGRFIKGKLESYAQFYPEKAFQDFREKVQVRTGRSRMIRKAGIAAAITVMALGCLWFWKRTDTTIDQVTVAKEQVIEPGNKKAILKLADGNTVNVYGDSMQIKAKEGAEIDYVNGTLSYKAKENVKELVFNELTVPVAGECYLILDDGTKVWVNSDSRLKYPVKFMGKERRVYLEGEAYFDVVKDGKPFIVQTSLGNINVLGTSFNVKAYGEENAVYTTLVNGKVRFNGQQTIDILPGEQAVAYLDGKLEKRNVNLEEYVGWKDGLYVFKKQSLVEIMSELSRWYDVTIFYQNPELKDVNFTGNLKRYATINTFMDLLQRTGDVKYKINGNTIILYK